MIDKHITLHSRSGPALVIENDSPLVSAIPQVMAEIVVICRKPDHDKMQARNKLRILGDRLYVLGGHPAMQMGCYLIQALWAQGELGDAHNPDTFHASALNDLWDGIGLWVS